MYYCTKNNKFCRNNAVYVLEKIQQPCVFCKICIYCDMQCGPAWICAQAAIEIAGSCVVGCLPVSGTGVRVFGLRALSMRCKVTPNFDKASYILECFFLPPSTVNWLKRISDALIINFGLIFFK